MKTIDASIIYDAVYELIFKANCNVGKDEYSKLQQAFDSEINQQSKQALGLILQNANLAQSSSRSLCQDSGQVIVFVTLGQDIHITNGSLEKTINNAVADCYTKNFLRKSVVKDALFDRTNTKDNTPAIIYTTIVEGECFEIDIMLKGAGSENMSKIKMFTPSATPEDISVFILDSLKSAGMKPCPPLFLGIGIGGTMEKAALLSKQALLNKNNQNEEFANNLHSYLNENLVELGFTTPVLNVNVITASTHIASLPVALTICCHSNRHASCHIYEQGFQITSEFACAESINILKEGIKNVHTDDMDTLRNLKKGEQILLSGSIYTARDAAHKRIFELLDLGQVLPFDIKDKMIFYAGPAPAMGNEVIGPFGPTTSSRMDTFAPKLYDLGVIATIGKGERNLEVAESIRLNNALYFSVTGGVACYLQQAVKKAEIIAFEELLSEAVYLLEIEKLPLTVEITSTF